MAKLTRHSSFEEMKATEMSIPSSQTPAQSAAEAKDFFDRFSARHVSNPQKPKRRIAKSNFLKNGK